jgi:hypothetical protein
MTRLLTWSKSDEALAMHEQNIPVYVISKKFQLSASQVHNMLEQGKRRRLERMGNTERERLIKHGTERIDPRSYILPCDVLIPKVEAIVCVQAGCELSTLIEALRGKR